MSPEARVAARKALALDLSKITLRQVVAKLPLVEQAVRDHSAARLRVELVIERYTVPPNKRQPNPAPQVRATIRTGKTNAIVELTPEQKALFLG